MPSDRPPPPYERFAQHWTYGIPTWLGPEEFVYVANLTGQPNLWHQRVGPGGERGFARPLTAYRDRAVRGVLAAADGRSVFFTADEAGDEQFQIYRVDVRGGDPEPITADRTVRHELGDLHPGGRQLLYVDNGRTPSDMDVVVHDLARGTTRRPLPTDALWEDPTWDPNGRRFFALKVLLNTWVQTFVHDPKRGTTTEVLPHESEELVAAQGWSRDGRGLYVISDVGQEFARLEYVDVESGKVKVLLDPGHPVEDCRLARRSGTVLARVNEEGYSTLYWARPGGRFRRVRGLPPGTVVPGWGPSIDLSADGRRLLAIWHTGSKPAEILWLRLAGGSPRTLTEAMPGGVPGGPLPPPRLVRYRSFDGRLIPAFLYAPKRRPEGPAPAVLSIHGGPESQERPAWSYFGFYATLLAHGIYVLAPNFRGSTGYGKTYQKLIHHDWGGGELEDFKAAAEWLRGQPAIDGRRLGVFGGSFGGFATLSCLTRLPEYWRVGVDVVGPSNLITFVQTVPPFWTRFMDRWVGNPTTEADFLRARSPIAYVDRLRADLLVIQGANDPRVNRAESDQMVERLRALGRKVDYLVFDDEGHGFTKTENLLRALGASARFLIAHLTAPAGGGLPALSD